MLRRSLIIKALTLFLLLLIIYILPNNYELPELTQDNDDLFFSIRLTPNQTLSDKWSKKISKTALLVIACNRPQLIGNTLKAILRYMKPADNIPVIVSQGCEDEETSKVIGAFGTQLTHIQRNPANEKIKIPQEHLHFVGYYRLALHYKQALGQLFNEMNFDKVIVLEDDLEISPDFFQYFQHFAPLLDKDPSIMCISAWNDNGKPEFVADPFSFYRTDHFPGLGWMLKKSLWAELEPKWPVAFWDDWMRGREQRRDRSCIRPEISRTKNMGRVGVSQGQYFDEHVGKIVGNSQTVDFSKINLDRFVKANYDRDFMERIYGKAAVLMPSLDALKEQNTSNNEAVYRIEYGSTKEYEEIAKRVGLMSDTLEGLGRTMYQGVVCFRVQTTLSNNYESGKNARFKHNDGADPQLGSDFVDDSLDVAESLSAPPICCLTPKKKI